MIENTEAAMKKGQSRKTGNIDENTKKQNTICAGHHSIQVITNNVNKTCVLLQTTGGKGEPNLVLCGNRNGHHNTELRT